MANGSDATAKTAGIILLSPAAGAVLMTVSIVIVAINANTLKVK